MVSLWPWKGEDNSPASFERTLSSLAAKITASQTQLDSLRQRGRRAKALWTLYSSFAYLLCFVILFLVVGWRNWTALEYAGVAGSPLIIWVIRTGITTYYTYRIDAVTERLDTQQKERTKTIDKLKAATKYNSTQELLEKYGGGPAKPKKESTGPKTPRNPPKQPQRTTIGAPNMSPTIRLPVQMPSQPSTPQQLQQQLHGTLQAYQAPPHVSVSRQLPGGQAEFAPNAFSAPPQYAGGEITLEGHWYDRILDLLLGEDETSPRNRVALICKNCRLVNGQAPAGVKNLAELGKWRCFGCGTMNAEEDEAAKVVKEIKERIGEDAQDQPVSPSADEPLSSENKAQEEVPDESDSGKEDIKQEVVEEGDGSAEDEAKVKPRRGRSSRKKTS